ncbi:DUF881 domain-containing protein [Intrasporangium calvum]|uniref:Division initiation protein n=1 Tax=Intrasporangium calvum (strain ATCC 23552 / DSM 43043 / JCM 3097 / NBRC 12989 / NCIMB 10167 / NRRL B-3866 / 7 KIP) TaxID=710696 RepID=E6SAR0_INTC7|nr:DUF881 domain-containing protein [Intrasporangium calvum]ADU48333.1 protein of unknown function DUF881 [Intrasporangium calvum DSM 43043]
MARRKRSKSKTTARAQVTSAPPDTSTTAAPGNEARATPPPAPEPTGASEALPEEPSLSEEQIPSAPPPEGAVEPSAAGPGAAGEAARAEDQPQDAKPVQARPGDADTPPAVAEMTPTPAVAEMTPTPAVAEMTPTPAVAEMTPTPAVAGTPAAVAGTPAAVTPPTPPATSAGEAGPAAYGLPSAMPVEQGSAPPTVPPGHVEGKAAWRRLLRMSKPRTTKANALGALLAIALGVAIATQVQLTNERGLSELSQTDLIRLLDDITSRSSRLDQQIHELEITRDRLLSGTGSAGEALEQAQRRADTLGILAGTIGAQGPGITVSITDPDRGVSGPVVLDLIQELRDAGAESIEVGGVRVVASSYVGDASGTLSVDGQPIRRPILVKAIGDPNTLASAMTIPGGIVETIRLKGANASVNQAKSITITSVHTPVEPVHAKPVQ